MFNHTIDTLPAYQTTGSMNIFSLTICLLWGAAELLISMGVLTAFSFIICYGFGAALNPRENRFDDSETPSKENTASIFMSAMLSAFHITFVFFGLPLFGHADESFAARLILSFAIIAALTTGVALGTIVVCMAAPAVRSCCRSVVGLIRKTPSEQDVEAQVEREAFIPDQKDSLLEKE